MSALPPIVLKKSFLADERNFLGPLMCIARGDVRDHVVSHKNDHGPSYRPCRALQRQRRLKIHFREIFRVVRFSTFATVSPRKRTFRQRFNSKSGQSPCPSSRAIDSAVELSKSAIASKRRQLRSPIRWGRSSVLVGYWLGTGGVLVLYRFRTGGTPNDCDRRGTAYIRIGRLAVSVSHLLFRFSARK